MTAPTRPQPWLPVLPFFVGWALGALAFVLVRWLGERLLTDPCQGHTLLALLMPLVLGPGGLGLTITQWEKPKVAALGLGFVVASFLPALGVAAQDLGRLRASGCAGGYIIVTPQQGGQSVSETALKAGETQTLTGRIGGYGPPAYPEAFALSAKSALPGLQLSVSPAQVRAGEAFTVTVHAPKDMPLNIYDWTLEAKYLGVPPHKSRRGDAPTASALLKTNVVY
ncbi:hypothetical protein ACFP81_04750 [Deinococcus lacus]|uniref:DUF4131 domain-containing protein n=1 Tax=Deinococcus lacus TaxID=392561 RepID=A0ABW1YB65_9DEIO